LTPRLDWDINQVSEWVKALSYPQSTYAAFLTENIDGMALYELQRYAMEFPDLYLKFAMKRLGFLSLGEALRFSYILRTSAS
jgi:hypothetical protein